MSEAGQARRLARSTATFTLATGLSRALGLVREVVSAYFFGATGKINAFTVASQIPIAGARVRGRRSPLGRLRPRLQRADGEGGQGPRLAGRLDDLLARPPRRLRADGAPHPARAASDPALRRPRRRPGARRHPDPDPDADRRPADGLGRDRRDPQRLRPVHGPGARARRSGTSSSSAGSSSASPRGRRVQRADPVRGRDAGRDRRAAAPAGPVAARPRRPAPGRSSTGATRR